MLKPDMYVRCPSDLEDQNNPRRFILGKIINIESYSNIVSVKFYDFNNLMSPYCIPSVETYDLNKITHCKIYENTSVRIRALKRNGRIICFSHEDRLGFFHYFIELKNGNTSEIKTFCEKDLIVTFNKGEVNPYEQILNWELQNPMWYLNRQIVLDSLHTLRNATYGFETLVGSRVLLLPHQVDTIVRAISESLCRFMLADEVGLGKTIEACVILKGLEKKFGHLKTIIIAPESLVYQWKTELSYKFWKDFVVWSKDNSSSKQLIFPLEKINSVEGRKILSNHWDLCIIDETHRLLNLNKEFKFLLTFSNKVQHLLLLTATPIMSRKTEYLKLLSLLQPEKYKNMSESQFSLLMEKQEKLRGIVHRLVRDLEYYIEDELMDDYIDDLQDIGDIIEDKMFYSLINQIDTSSDDYGLNNVKLALAYIGEHYQIERKVIRHRRAELKDNNAKRKLEAYSYMMVGSNYSFYEEDSYEELKEYLLHFHETENMEGKVGKFHSLLLSAFFSSPMALLRLLEDRKKIIQSKSTSNLFEILHQLTPVPNELGVINNLINTVGLWKQAVIHELNSYKELYEEPDLIKGRLMKVLDYVSDSGDDEKFVIFTTWTDTLLPLKEVFIKKYGKEVVRSFYKGMTDEELQASVDDFQRNANCRFMLCDELGGEGRNFQIANKIIHVDIPWSPVHLEQRIGRLDRIGRKDDVISVVFYTEDSIESELLNLWEKGLNIFSESLSGIEIALGDIQKEIIESLGKDLSFGLRDILGNMTSKLQEMRNLVQEERYYDMARHLDPYVEEQFTKLINKFEENNGSKLANTMMTWASMAGFKGIPGEEGNVVIFKPEKAFINSMINSLFVPPDMNEARKRAKRLGEIRGTFDREYAVRREDLIFYAPGDPFFDAIVSNSEESPRGTSCAFLIPSPIDWKGFVLTWSVSLEPKYLLRKGYNLENLTYGQGYIPLDPIIIFHGLTNVDQEKDANELHDIIFGKVLNKSEIIHLGKRGYPRSLQGSTLDWFKNEFGDNWALYAKAAYEVSQLEVKKRMESMIDVVRAQNDFQRKFDGFVASNLYFGKDLSSQTEEVERLKSIHDCILKGLKFPNITLQSMAFVYLKGK